MKQIFLYAMCIAMLTSAAQAQSAKESKAKDQGEPFSGHVKLGPTIDLTLAMNTTDYHVSGPKRSVGFGSMFGVTADIPFSPTISGIATLGYYTLAFSDKNIAIDVNPNSDNDNAADVKFGSGQTLTTDGSVSYVALATMVRFEYFAIGFNWGLPMSATVKNSGITMPQSHGQLVLKEDISPASSDINFLIEARIAGDFPIVESNSGTLRFGVMASYPLTTIKDKSLNTLPRLDDNFRLPTVQFGLAYMFSL